MTAASEASTPRIVLRVAPRLLGDVLSLALRERGLEVELALDDAPPSLRILSERFDLAVVSDGLAGDVIADTVLVLDASGTSLSVSREVQERRLGGDELDGLVAAIADLIDADRARR